MVRKPRYQTANTLMNESILIDFINKNGRPPKTGEIAEMLGIDKSNASGYAAKVKEIFKERLDEKLNEVSDKLIGRIRERLIDEEKPMSDENLIKLLEYAYPKKVESKQVVEQNVNVGAVDGLKAELENYAKLFPATEPPRPS